MLPSGSKDHRPCHKGCAICLLVPPFPGLPACVRSRPLVRPSPIGPRSLRLVLACALRTVVVQSFCHSRVHLPASLCSTPVMALLRSYEGSVFHRSFSASGGSPRFTASELLCRSVSNHPMSCHLRFISLVLFAFWTLPRMGPFPVCAPRVSGLRLSPAGSPRHQAESSSSRTDRQTRLRLLSTPPSGAMIPQSLR